MLGQLVRQVRLLQGSLVHNRVDQHHRILLPVSKFSATVLEQACHNEDHDVTKRKGRLPCCHHLQSKRLQVSPVAVVLKNYLYASSKSGEQIYCACHNITQAHAHACQQAHGNTHKPRQTHTHARTRVCN